jgi:hypothetical protein
MINITSAGKFDDRDAENLFGNASTGHFPIIITLAVFGFSAGIISLLSEPVNELKVYALQQLNSIVDQFWPEISEAIEKM